jgi:predicted esterase
MHTYSGGDMNIPPHSDEEFVLNVKGKPHKVLVRTPAVLTRKPAMLLCLGSTRTDMLNLSSYQISPNIFLAAGHRVASFDLPNHGDLVNEFGEGLEGMAAAMAAGVDVFGEIAETGSSFIDFVLEKNLTTEGVIVLDGTSRGGCAALHIMANDLRVLATAVHYPLTYLPIVREFSHLADNEIVKKTNAISLVDKLADRRIFISIGETDPRVDSRRTFELHAAISAASHRILPKLFVVPGESHGLTCPDEIGHYAGAAFLLYACAEQLKGKIES